MISGQDAATQSSFWRRLVAGLEDPILLEVAGIAVGVALLGWMLWSIRSSLGRLRRRRLVTDYLDGVEAMLSGDAEAATELLSAVVEADPENVGARLALGDAFYALERPADAHRHHVEASQVFAARGPRVELALARDLRAAGEPLAAIERLDAALRRHPRDEALLQEAFALRLEAGLLPEALEAGRALYQSRGGAELRQRLAATAARSGLLMLGRGERTAAARLFDESLDLDAENREARRGRLLLGGNSERLLLAAAAPADTALVRAGNGGGALEAAAPSRPLAAVLDLFPEACCARCRSPRPPAAEASCPVCGNRQPAVYGEPDFARPLADPDGCLDEIEENESWFARLAARARDADQAAAEELRTAGGTALAALLSTWLADGDRDGRLQALCVDLARQSPEALFAARARLRQAERGVFEWFAGRADLDVFLAPIVRHLGQEARPFFTALLEDPGRLADRGVRELVVDYFVGLADLEAFEELAERYAPVELVRRLNRLPPEELAGLIAALPDGASFLRESILLDPALHQDEAIVLAALAASPPAQDRLLALLRQRGPGPGVLSLLVRKLCGEAAVNAERLLGAFTGEAIEHLVQGLADPDAAAAHGAIGRLLLAAGPRAVPELVRCFGAQPGEADDRVSEVLFGYGRDAVPALEQGYRQQAGWLGRLGARFRPRHPRAAMVRVLGRLGQVGGREALRRLLDYESDAELSSLIGELLRRGGDPEGQA